MTVPDTSQKSLIALAFDGKMFEQARQCIETIRAHCRHPADIGVLAIDLAKEQIDWLRERGVLVRSDYSSLPCFRDAPPYAHAMTCRPYLAELFAGYAVYLWVDADIRIADDAAFDFYLASVLRAPGGAAICQEADPAYAFVFNPPQARLYHARRYERVLRAFGKEAADKLQYFLCYNAGMFSMHRDSPLWGHYRRYLEQAMSGSFDHMIEQDALSLAIARHGAGVSVGPSTLNWLCSIALPRFRADLRRWVHPMYTNVPISVLHLTNSFDRAPVQGENITWYQCYQRMNLTR